MGGKRRVRFDCVTNLKSRRSACRDLGCQSRRADRARSQPSGLGPAREPVVLGRARTCRRLVLPDWPDESAGDCARCRDGGIGRLGVGRDPAAAGGRDLRGHHSYEEAVGIFSRYLPYAIVLGVADHWTRVFSDLAASAGGPGLELGWLGISGWGIDNPTIDLAMLTSMAAWSRRLAKP